MGSGKCTGKDDEAQKEDPGEESGKAVVDDQEPLLAPPLLRIGHPRAGLSRHTRCRRWDCRVLTFLGIRRRGSRGLLARDWRRLGIRDRSGSGGGGFDFGA
jgi:hypothetical protein